MSAPKRRHEETAVAGEDEPVAKRLRSDATEHKENRFSPVGILVANRLMPIGSEPWMLWDFCVFTLGEHVVCRTVEDGRSQFFLLKMGRDRARSSFQEALFERDKSGLGILVNDVSGYSLGLTPGRVYVDLDALLSASPQAKHTFVVACPFDLCAADEGARHQCFRMFVWTERGRWVIGHWKNRSTEPLEDLVFEVLPNDQDWLSFGVNTSSRQLIESIDAGTRGCLPAVLLTLIVNEYCVLLNNNIPPGLAVY